MIEPVPCIFCKKKPRVFPENTGAYGEVFCINRRCLVKPKVDDGQRVAYENRDYRLYAIKRWNKAMSINK